MKVRLDECEISLGMAVGCWRHARVIREGLKAGHGEAGATDLVRHMNGALGELALAKALGVYWGGSSADFGKDGDVARFEVRTTSHERGSLIAYPNDPPGRLLVLVVLGPTWARIAGYISAGNARLVGSPPPPRMVRPGSPQQWWVAQERLTPIGAAFAGTGNVYPQAQAETFLPEEEL